MVLEGHGKNFVNLFMGFYKNNSCKQLYSNHYVVEKDGPMFRDGY